ncbi:MAG TPA: GNAT family N-acetyltransferase [Candidatus Limnocylindria bacterium]|nr:GNAT family N-acetyltransferase [Candidatus Limnocylindria bacterium]
MPPLTDPSLTLRPGSLADAQAVADLINAADDHDYGAHDVTVDDILEEMGGTDAQHDLRLVWRDGQLVGMGGVQPRAGVRFTTTIYVHPDARRQGIGTQMLRFAEERADAHAPKAPADAQLSIVGWVNAEQPEMVGWAEHRGYERVRDFLRMQIQLDERPRAPRWPEGVSVRTYQPDDARPLFHAVEEAFSDHWGHLPMEFDDWMRRTERSDFDPTLWFLATEGDEIVAMSLAALMVPDGGWVGSVGVRRPWRQRGIARALLLETFGELYRRGRRWAALGVDADSLTGATRLYESVGMRVRERHAQMRKIIRDGREIEISSID